MWNIYRWSTSISQYEDHLVVNWRNWPSLYISGSALLETRKSFFPLNPCHYPSSKLPLSGQGWVNSCLPLIGHQHTTIILSPNIPTISSISRQQSIQKYHQSDCVGVIIILVISSQPGKYGPGVQHSLLAPSSPNGPWAARTPKLGHKKKSWLFSKMPDSSNFKHRLGPYNILGELNPKFEFWPDLILKVCWLLSSDFVF